MALFCSIGKKAKPEDRNSPNWAPTIRLSSEQAEDALPKFTGETFDDEFPDTISNNAIEFPILESDSTVCDATEQVFTIQEVNECNENFKLEMPENLSEETQSYIAKLHCKLKSQEDIIDVLKGKKLNREKKEEIEKLGNTSKESRTNGSVKRKIAEVL